ncbi:hypothetical protein ACKI10_18160 [Streptomyces galilaeus]|uniref:hypothetical protein n=1 Tax=Streptomyces galilaeus TaxID=33899 RepID=UPI0038F6E749
MKRRTVILFGKAYVWCTHEGKLTLHPDVDGYVLFPQHTARAILRGTLAGARDCFR